MSGYESACFKAGCHGRVCLTAEVYERARRTHENFYCSAGHAQHFVGKTDEQVRIERLERELDDAYRRALRDGEVTGSLREAHRLYTNEYNALTVRKPQRRDRRGQKQARRDIGPPDETFTRAEVLKARAS